VGGRETSMAMGRAPGRQCKALCKISPKTEGHREQAWERKGITFISEEISKAQWEGDSNWIEDRPGTLRVGAMTGDQNEERGVGRLDYKGRRKGTTS